MSAPFKSCIAYLPASGTYGPCRNGFPQTGPCRGFANDVAIPVCMNEKLCGRLYAESGGKPPAHLLNLAKSP